MVKGTCDEILRSEDELREMIKRLGKQITEDYQGKDVVVVGVLCGAFVFMADLIREIKLPISIDFIRVKSYDGENSTGVLKYTKNLEVDITGKHVIIVEDIIDTGNTLYKLKKQLAEKAASVAICAAFNKPSRRLDFAKDMEVEYVGFEIPNKFVVGYGLDYNECMRNLPDLRIFKPED